MPKIRLFSLIKLYKVLGLRRINNEMQLLNNHTWVAIHVNFICSYNYIYHCTVSISVRRYAKKHIMIVLILLYWLCL